MSVIGRAVIAIVVAGPLLTGCGSPGPEFRPAAAAAPAAPLPVARPEPPATTPVPAIQAASFADFLAQFRSQAIAAGIRAETVDRAFAGIELNSRVLDLDTSQPEFVRPIWQYLDNAISTTRVNNGRNRLAENGATLQEVAARYGVPPEIVLAIWGIETDYGRDFGSFSVVEVLASMAYQGRRQAFGRSELMAALRILDRGDIVPERMLGSWAGAMGHTQFIPTTFEAHAVDFNGDGRRDLWGTLPDAFASTANYLAVSGWQRGLPALVEVTLPPSFNWSLADGETKRPVGQWQALGVAPVAGGRGLPEATAQAAILLPAGHRGPAFLITDNYRAILAYNNSTSYAVAVSHLAARIAGGGPIAGAWPRDLPPLNRASRIELQERLIAQGFDTGGADGVFGRQTRAAVRAYQQAIGLPADGYPTADLLARLRRS